jgi:hypothetical protein
LEYLGINGFDVIGIDDTDNSSPVLHYPIMHNTFILPSAGCFLKIPWLPPFFILFCTLPILPVLQKRFLKCPIAIVHGALII